MRQKDIFMFPNSHALFSNGYFNFSAHPFTSAQRYMHCRWSRFSHAYRYASLQSTKSKYLWDLLYRQKLDLGRGLQAKSRILFFLHTPGAAKQEVAESDYMTSLVFCISWSRVQLASHHFVCSPGDLAQPSVSAGAPAVFQTGFTKTKTTNERQARSPC